MTTSDTESDESIHDRQSLDGTENTLESITVPDDELWHVEGAYITTDGSGDASGIEVAVAVADETTLDAMDLPDRAGRGASVGVDTTIPDGGFAEIDAHASGGEEIRLVETYEDGSTGGYHYSLQLRRVL